MSQLNSQPLSCRKDAIQQLFRMLLCELTPFLIKLSQAERFLVVILITIFPRYSQELQYHH